MADTTHTSDNGDLKTAPMGLAVLAMVGPSMVWAAEYIGSGEVILATRVGAILGTGVLWAIVVGIFLKFWIGMSGARYTLCTGEGMIDMFSRIPGPRNWVVWTVLIVQFVAGAFSIGAVATAAGVFLSNLLPSSIVPMAWKESFPSLCGWLITFLSVVVVWSGVFNIIKIVMSVLVGIIVIGVIYVAAHVFPGGAEFIESLSFKVPVVPDWAMAKEGIDANPWGEILPLLGWGAGGFASQVWYTYWVLGAGYGAAAGRSYGQPADVKLLSGMNTSFAQKIKGWCRVLYVDSSLAMIIGIVATGAFFIAGAGVLGPEQVAPKGPDVAIKLSGIFSGRWGNVGGFLFMLAGTAALISTQIGQLAGWPRLLADSCRICFPGFNRKLPWKWQFRLFLLFFVCSNMVITFAFEKTPVRLVQTSSLLDGLLLTPLQALWIVVGLFIVLPKLLSKEAYKILRPHWIFAVGLVISFLVFSYFCIVQMPSVFNKLIRGQ